MELSFKGIFRISPTGTLRILDSTTFNKPNGICFSLDEKKLYVNESPQCKIYIWDVINDSIIANKKVFYTIPKTGYADGMKVDAAGNLYCTGPTGVWIISPSGVCLDTIVMPNNESPSNCNWGDADMKTLYITSNKSLYRIRLATTTKVETRKDERSKSFKLFENYPNPFNPTTNISFSLPVESTVTLIVYDVLGREVKRLLNDRQQVGTHTIPFNASTLPSGSYFYRMYAATLGKDFVKTNSQNEFKNLFTQTKKMLLLR
jgi:gluconolactonase